MSKDEKYILILQDNEKNKYLEGKTLTVSLSSLIKEDESFIIKEPELNFSQAGRDIILSPIDDRINSVDQDIIRRELDLQMNKLAKELNKQSPFNIK